LEAIITLEYVDERFAKAVAEAISPDNFKTPSGLKVQTLVEDCKVITRILCEGKLATFTATIDDLLFCASTAEKAVKAVNENLASH
jgi:hypothetical protein